MSDGFPPLPPSDSTLLLELHRKLDALHIGQRALCRSSAEAEPLPWPEGEYEAWVRAVDAAKEKG